MVSCYSCGVVGVIFWEAFMVQLREGLELVKGIGKWAIAVEYSKSKSGDTYYAVNTETGEEVYKGRYTERAMAIESISNEIKGGIATKAGRFVNPTVSAKDMRKRMQEQKKDDATRQ